ncbi:MAG: PQQ-like beta-propeller repeat protein [Candidatus Marinimicrobia bacterium]|nr:PQQ-like beta-propeller repeat protein [Candidatus Neomarinimicrobiota bacterium]
MTGSRPCLLLNGNSPALAALLLIVLAQGCGRGLRLSPEDLHSAPAQLDLRAKPELAWTVKLRSPPAALLPLGSQAILVTTHRGELYRINLETGLRDSPILRPLRKAITAQLVAGEQSTLYIASARGQELRAYDLLRGKLKWRRKKRGVTGPVILTDGMLVTAGLGGEVAAYDAGDGRSIWRRQLPGRIYRGVWGLDSLALILTDGGTLYAFRTRIEAPRENDGAIDHAPLWQRELSLNPTAVVASGDGQLVLGDSDGNLLGIDSSGEEPQFHIRLDAPIYSRPVVIEGRVVVATAAGEVIALQLESGLPLWRVQGEGLVNAPLLAAGGGRGDLPATIVVPFARGILLALELTTGRELWRYDLEGPIALASLTSGGIVVVGRRGELRYLQPPLSRGLQRP